MKATKKFTWGIILSIIGSILLAGGLALSLTLIGACVGIPMVLLGLPMMIWGIVWVFQGQSQKQQEVIAAGVKDGLKAGLEGSRKSNCIEQGPVEQSQ